MRCTLRGHALATGPALKRSSSSLEGSPSFDFDMGYLGGGLSARYSRRADIRAEMHNCIQLDFVRSRSLKHLQCKMPLKAVPTGTDRSTYRHSSRGHARGRHGLEKQMKSNWPCQT